MTHSRHRKSPTSAVNHRRISPEKPTTPITTTKEISKSPEPHSRIFTEKDEIQLLKTLSQSPNKPYNTNFTSTQIAKKLKRLKEKYHKLARSKSLIKTPHDREIYEIGRTIWGRNANAAKGKELLGVELHESFEGVIILEDFTFLMNEMKAVFERNEGYYCKEGLRRLGKKKLKEMNEKWMELKLEESEVMMSKAQLYNDYLKCVVESSKGCSSSSN